MQDLIEADDPDLTLCEAVQIALEMDARGALAPGQRSRLETHIAACDECRAFRHAQLRTDATLREVLQRESGPGSAAGSAAFVARMRRLRRRGWLFVPFVVALTIGGLFAGDWAANGAVRHPWEMCAVAAMCLIPGLAIWAWRRGRLSALLAGDDVVAAHRRLLVESLRVHRLARVLWVAGLLFHLVLVMVQPDVLRDPIARVALPVSDVLVLAALVWGTRRIGALRRELARMR
jgi:hypothetical protein